MIIFKLDLNKKPMEVVTRLLLIALIITSCNISSSKNEFEILTVPAGDKFTEINVSGTTVLPSGRLLTPAGEMIRITNDPFGMTS
jgi:hypothetical protein